MPRVFKEQDAINLKNAIYNRTPIDTGSLRASIRYEMYNNGFVVIIGKNGWTSQAGKTPYKYVRYVNNGVAYNKKHKNFIQNATRFWALKFAKDLEYNTVGVFYDQEEQY